jgi:sec-independent protein translocase protein TatA
MFFAKPYWDALIVIVIVLLFFGPKRLPALGKSLGQGMREFKDSISGKSHGSDDEERPELTAASSAPEPAARPPAEPASVSGSPSQSQSAPEQRA